MGLSTGTSAEFGIVAIKKFELYSVSNRPSKKPKTVDGGNADTISTGDVAINVNKDRRLGIGIQLNDDFDNERAVIKFFIASLDNAFKVTGEVIVPSMELKTDLGRLFKTPGGSENNPFKNSA